MTTKQKFLNLMASSLAASTFQRSQKADTDDRFGDVRCTVRNSHIAETLLGKTKLSIAENHSSE